MFEDDLNATVMIERFESGAGFGPREGSVACREVRWSDKREKQTWLVSEWSTKLRGERSNYERVQAL